MHAVSRSVHTVLAALAASLAILVVARLPSAWSSGNGLNHAAGAWTALALDLSGENHLAGLQAARVVTLGCVAGTR
jgi:hypothetical protein